MTEQELIQEARKKGYKKGSVIHYYPERNDYTDTVEGDYFETDDEGNLRAYAKPEYDRKSFDDFTHDVLYNAESKEWVKLIS